MKFYFQTATLSRSGGRDYNEDGCGAEEGGGGPACWVVADGLGGHGGGDVASRLCVNAILMAFRKEASLSPRKIEQAFNDAQMAILVNQQESRLSAMRSTAVMLQSDGRSVLWGHVGDSRLYFFRGGRLAFQTEDHSVPQMMVASGDITTAGIRLHEDRNRLLRTIGNSERLKPTIKGRPVSLEKDDAFLLCTDGFWEYVLETEMEADLAKSKAPQQWLQFMEDRLLQRVTGDNDNYTAAAILVDAA